MRIAILTPTFSGFSGPDRVVMNEVEDYFAKGHQVNVFTFYSDIKTNNAKVVNIGAPKNPTLERIYRLFFFLDFVKINKIVKELRDFDEVVSFLYPMTIIASKARKKYNMKYTYYDMGIAPPGLFGSLWEKLFLKLFLFFTKLTVANADEAISISNYLKAQLRKDTGLNSRVKYVRIDEKRFNRNISRAKALDIRKKYGISGPMVLYVGRISPHKGIHLLIKAFNVVSQKFPDAKLVIVGKHTFRDYSRMLRKIANNNIVFTGYVPDGELPHYYAACDVYATASLWEGFDMPAAEAQACGKPVVAFDAGSHREVISNRKLLKPGDIKGFAEAIKKIIRK